MTYLMLFFVLPMLTACQNVPVGPPPPTASITIHSPAENSEYHKGDTIFIRADIKSSATLHGYDITLREAKTGQQLFFRHIHSHGQELNVNYYWVHNQKWSNELTEPTEVELEVSVLLDHADTRESLKVKVVCKP